MRASELATFIGGEFLGNQDPELDSVAPINEAGNGQVAFVHNTRYRRYLDTTGASCVVLPLKFAPKNPDYAVIACEEPHRAMALAVEIMYPEKPRVPGISSMATVEPSASIGVDVVIEAGAFVGPGSVIGDRCYIGPSVTIMEDVHLGPDCRIYANVAVYPKTWIGEKCIVHSGSVLGSDGFGFVPLDSSILKVRQVGRLVIEQEVEIGANCTLDRGSFTETRIGRGTKLDNMVHVAHNCRIGEYCLIAAQSGLAGSTVLGDRVLVAGQVGFAGHQTIGDGCLFYAKSGINGDVPSGSCYFGYPAKDRMTSHRENVYISRLGDFFKRLKAIEDKIQDKDESEK